MTSRSAVTVVVAALLACASAAVAPGGAATAPTATGQHEDAAAAESPLEALAAADQLAMRLGGPSTVLPGAYASAIGELRGVAPAGTLPGTGNAWSRVGRTPLRGNDPTFAVSKNGIVSMSGRATALAQDAADGLTFAGAADGGVYVSRDLTTWTSVGDRLPTQTVGALAFDAPTRTLLVGTGDNSFGGDGFGGLGIFRSSDGGASYTASSGVPEGSLLFRIVVSPADPTGRTVYAATSRGLYRSLDGGATFVNLRLPTTPAGYAPDCAGDTTTPLCFFASIVTDVVVRPVATAAGPAGAVLAVVGWRAGQKHDKNPDGSDNMHCSLGSTPTVCLQAPQNGLYSSAGGDPGSFAFIPSATTSSTNGFALQPRIGRVSLGIAHGAGQNPDAVYALNEDAAKFNGCLDVLDTTIPLTCDGAVVGLGAGTVLDGAYASYDFGRTWTKIMDWTQLQAPVGTNSALAGYPGYRPGVQSWYNSWIDADPSVRDAKGNPTRVLFGLEEVWENTVLPLHNTLTDPFLLVTPTTHWQAIGRYFNDCGGLSVTSGIICNPSLAGSLLPGTTTHPDQHADLLLPDAAGGVTLVVGNDGGIERQHVAAGSDFSNDRWTPANAGLDTLQAYDAEISRDGTVVAGLQDNGEMKISPDGTATEIFGGDGFFTTIDPGNSRRIIESYTYGSLNYTTDGGATWNSNTPTNCGAGLALFATPVVQDPATAGHVVAGCSQIAEAVNAYTGATFANVFDLGKARSGANKVPSAIDVHGANVYVGFCGYCDIVTQKLPFANGLATNVGGAAAPATGTSKGWHVARATGLPARYITAVAMDPASPSTVYVGLAGYGRRWIPPGSLGDSTAGVGTGHVFKSTDAGASFTDISANLPDTPVESLLVRNGRLIVGSAIGVFISADAPTSSFGVLGTGLPNTPVFSLRLSPGDPNRLVAATFGRGVVSYQFADAPATAPVVTGIPNTGAGEALAPLAGLLAAATLATGIAVRRRRSNSAR